MFHGFKVQLAPFGSLRLPVFSQLVNLIITVKATFNLQFLANHHSKNIGIKSVKKSLSRSINFFEEIPPWTITVGTTPSEIQDQIFLSFVLMNRFQYISNPPLI